MSVTFILIGSLKQFCSDLNNGKDRLVFEGQEGRSIKVVCQEIGIPNKLISVCIVNGKTESRDHILQHGDEIRLIAVMGGG
jgi:sulfur carrier protein ThiS